MMEMRLKQWYNSSYKKLQAETFLYRTKNGGSLLSIRQYHLENNSSSKKAFIIFNSTNINQVINHLQMVKCGSKKILTGETSNIIIDEWDIQSVQSSQKRVTSELIAKEMEKYLQMLYTQTVRDVLMELRINLAMSCV